MIWQAEMSEPEEVKVKLFIYLLNDQAPITSAIVSLTEAYQSIMRYHEQGGVYWNGEDRILFYPMHQVRKIELIKND